MHFTCRAAKKVPLFLSIILTVFLSCSCQDGYVSIAGFAQGGTWTVKLNLDNPQGRVKVDPQTIKMKIDSILTRVDNSVSGYNKGSLLSHFNAGETIVPDDVFIELYEISYHFYDVTGGAFDAASGPLFDIWGFGFKDGCFPSDSLVEAVRSGCGMSHFRPDIRAAVSEDGTISKNALLSDPASECAVTLNYNAIAQGYSCDMVARYLYSIGVKDMLVDVGGEIYCAGVNPSGQPWKIGIDRPVDGNDSPGADIEGVIGSEGRACGIVTSGNYRKFYIKDGKKFAHTIDPRSGYPVSHSLLSATVTAADATTADAIATYCMVVGLEEAERFTGSFRQKSLTLPSVAASSEIGGYFIYDDRGTMKSVSSIASTSKQSSQ